ncbi:MAG: hypothetical protein R6V77_01970 [Candidatus Cloacimonadaceae bacterium]
MEFKAKENCQVYLVKGFGLQSLPSFFFEVQTHKVTCAMTECVAFEFQKARIPAVKETINVARAILPEKKTRQRYKNDKGIQGFVKHIQTYFHEVRIAPLLS